jgi:hypothetical protein
MKLLDKIKGLFTNKYDKVDRKQINNAIIDFETKKSEYENDLKSKENIIAEYFSRGKRSKSLSEKKSYSQKILVLRKQSKIISSRVQFINKKIQVLEDFKIAVDDRDFNRDTKNQELERLLSNTSGLQNFLSDVVSEKEFQDETLSSQINLLEDSLGSYEANENIYGETEDEQSILAMMTEDITETSENELNEEKLKDEESL